MGSFDQLSPGAIEALTTKESQADELLGSIATQQMIIEAPRTIELAEFSRIVEDSHIDTSRSFSRSGPNQNALPEFSNFEDHIEALKPYYEIMESFGLEPKVVFVPFNHSLMNWDSIVRGSSKRGIDGVSLSSNDSPDNPTLMEFSRSSTPQWDVSLVCDWDELLPRAGNDLTFARHKPGVSSIEALSSPYIQAILDAFEGRQVGADELKSKMAEYSPSFDEYVTFQLLRSVQGKTHPRPDTQYATLAREAATYRGFKDSNIGYYYWHDQEHKITAYFGSSMNIRPNGKTRVGFRPTITASTIMNRNEARSIPRPSSDKTINKIINEEKLEYIYDDKEKLEPLNNNVDDIKEKFHE